MYFGRRSQKFKSSHSDQLFPTFTIRSSSDPLANSGKRLFTGDSRSVQKAAGIDEVVGHGLVHHADIVEHHQISAMPFVAIGAIRRVGQCLQFIDKRAGFVIGQSINARRMRADKECPPSILAFGDQRMPGRWCCRLHL